MKIKKEFEKLLKSINNQELTKTDIDDLCETDPAFAETIKEIKELLEPPRWAVHPLYPHIRCSSEGDIEISGTRFVPIERDGLLKIVFANGKHKCYAAQLILHCFVPCPDKAAKSYTVGYKDNDYKNLRLNNLYWKKVI